MECCILFFHYRRCPVTERHYAIVRQANPYPVLPIRINDGSGQEGLDGSFFTEYIDKPWANADLALYEIAKKKVVDAERYILIEWDCLANMPVREWLGDKWDADATTTTLKTPLLNPDWCWWYESGYGEYRQLRLPKHLKRYQCGMQPCNGVMISRRMMDKLANVDIPPSICSERRLGTLIHSLGGVIQEAGSKNNNFNELWVRYDPNKPDIYHPVKQLKD